MEEVEKYGHTYISPHSLVYGDYGGAGSVGVANVRAILEMEEFKDSTMYVSHSEWARIGTDYEWKNDLGCDINCDDPPKVVHTTGGYGFTMLYLLECEETEDIIAQLTDYGPLIDEEIHSWVEMEWEEEAWDSWVRSELYDGLPEELQDAIDDQKPSDGKLYEAYRLAMDSTNTYPVPEYAGVHIDTKRIQDEYEDNVRTLLT